jgi:hypothetical protein
MSSLSLHNKLRSLAGGQLPASLDECGQVDDFGQVDEYRQVDKCELVDKCRQIDECRQISSFACASKACAVATLAKQIGLLFWLVAF